MLKRFFKFLRARKAYFIYVLTGAAFILAALWAVSSTSPVAPFIYTLH